jgi:hypothetical protein
MRYVLFLPILCLSACVTVSESNPTPQLIKPDRGMSGAPGKMVISPLTRVGIDTSGEAAIFLHVDFRDAGEKSMKAYGKLHVELYQGAPPALGAGAPSQPVTRSWDADLTDPVRNALTFDEMITRTYNINLGGVPEWLVRWSRHEADAPPPTIVAQFLPSSATTTDQSLRATYTLTR